MDASDINFIMLTVLITSQAIVSVLVMILYLCIIKPRIEEKKRKCRAFCSPPTEPQELYIFASSDLHSHRAFENTINGDFTGPKAQLTRNDNVEIPLGPTEELNEQPSADVRRGIGGVGVSQIANGFSTFSTKLIPPSQPKPEKLRNTELKTDSEVSESDVGLQQHLEGGINRETLEESDEKPEVITPVKHPMLNETPEGDHEIEREPFDQPDTYLIDLNHLGLKIVRKKTKETIYKTLGWHKGFITPSRKYLSEYDEIMHYSLELGFPKQPPEYCVGAIGFDSTDMLHCQICRMRPPESVCVGCGLRVCQQRECHAHGCRDELRKAF